MFAFSIGQGKLHANTAGFTIQELDTYKIKVLLYLCMFNQEFIYMHAQLNPPRTNFIAFNSGANPLSAVWQPAQVEH